MSRPNSTGHSSHFAPSIQIKTRHNQSNDCAGFWPDNPAQYSLQGSAPDYPLKAGVDSTRPHQAAPHARKSDPPLIALADAAERTAVLKTYRDTFARDPRGPYAIQWPDRPWTTRYKPVSDPLIEAHLRGKYWLATKGQWYPRFCALDFDAPKPGDVEKTLALFGADNNSVVCSSPSFWEDGSVHAYVALSYNDRPPTLALGRSALTAVVGDAAEVYPQARRKFRCPFGRDQHLIGTNGEPLTTMEWHEAMYWLEKLEPIPIETFPYQPPLPMPSAATTEDDPRTWRTHGDAAELWADGLQAKGSRHEACWTLAVSLWRNNYTPEEAETKIVNWLRRHHNGHSRAVNENDWRTVKAEVSRQVKWIWANFRPLPDGPHNADGAITNADVRFCAEVFPSDVVNQKRLLTLTAYYRPRRRHEFVFVPWRVWQEVAHSHHYQEFRAVLEAKGLLDSIHAYRHVSGRPDLSYSKKFRLHIPKTHDAPLESDGRNVVEYWPAVQAVCGSVRDAVALVGVHKKNVYRGFASIYGDKSFNFNGVA